MKRPFLLLFGLVGAAGLITQSAQAAFVVETRATATTGRGFGNFDTPGMTPDNSTASTTAPGTTTGIGSIFGGTITNIDTITHTYIFTYTPGVDTDNYSPSLGTVFNANQFGTNVVSTGAAGGQPGFYRVFLTWPSSTNIDPNGTDITATGETNNVELFGVNQNSNSNADGTNAINRWWHIGTVFLNTNTTYAVTSAAVIPSFVSQRFSAVMWEFVPETIDPCVNTPALGAVNGPLAAGQTNVTVLGVDGSATAVGVYQGDGTNMVKVGELTSGVVAGANSVNLFSPLTKGSIVSATQTISGQESCVQTIGNIVGGGANPSLRIAFNIRENTALTGPVGSDGGVTGQRLLHLGSSNLLGSLGPAGGVVLQPSTNWQTVTLQRGPDPFSPTNPTVVWNGGGPNELDGAFGVLEALSMAIEDLTDTGPYDLFIDNIMSGTNLIEGFESSTNGQLEVVFRAPSFSGTTSGNILPAPNVAAVSDLVADTGNNSLRVRFQWTDRNSNRWLRLTSNNTQVTPNPMVDLNEPISIRVLLLPVGATVTPEPPGPINIARQGDNVILDWDGTFTLQSAPAVTGTYTDVPGPVTTGPYTNAIGAGEQYFRLRTSSP